MPPNVVIPRSLSTTVEGNQFILILHVIMTSQVNKVKNANINQIPNYIFHQFLPNGHQGKGKEGLLVTSNYISSILWAILWEDSFKYVIVSEVFVLTVFRNTLVEAVG